MKKIRLIPIPIAHPIASTPMLHFPLSNPLPSCRRPTTYVPYGHVLPPGGTS